MICSQTNIHAADAFSCIPMFTSTGTTAMEELERFHYSYLNQDYNTDVLNSWTSGGCMDEIYSRLGYRLLVTTASFSPNLFIPGGDVAYSLILSNNGYSRPLQKYRFRLRFKSTDVECIMEDSSVDTRTWYANESHTVSGVARLPVDMPDGSYAVHLELAVSIFRFPWFPH